MINRKQNIKGFTLIELIIYISLVSMVMVGIITFSLNVIYSGDKSNIRREVQQNGLFAMERVINEIKGANDINVGLSTFDTDPGVLSLEHNDPTKDPTTIDVSNGYLQITQGTSGPYALNSNNLEVTSLIFKNHSLANLTKIIKVEMTIRHINADKSNVANAEMTLKGSAVIREQSD
jgi:type II secretory pathway pseudopilin PulG